MIIVLFKYLKKEKLLFPNTAMTNAKYILDLISMNKTYAKMKMSQSKKI